MNLDDKFPKRIPNATSTRDGLMSAKDKAQLDSIFEFGALAPVTQESNGVMIKEDKIKLDHIEEGANNYVHPNDANTRHVTDEQIEKWTNGSSIDKATTTTDGLMSKEDKTKLDSLSNYTHPNNINTRHVTDLQIASWDAKASVNKATTTTDGLMSKEDKTKLDSLSNYTHPNNSSTRHVTDLQIAAWDAKASANKATQTTDGLMSKEDKTKLDNISTGATNYVHPDDENTRHVTDEQIASWNAKASTNLASTLTNGLMSKEDKTKLDNLSNYTHPNNSTTRHVTDVQIAAWDAKASKDVATATTDGLMSKEDKTKLDGIPSSNTVSTSITATGYTVSTSNSLVIDNKLYNISIYAYDKSGSTAYGNIIIRKFNKSSTSTIMTVFDGNVIDYVQINVTWTSGKCNISFKSIIENIADIKYDIVFFN